MHRECYTQSMKNRIRIPQFLSRYISFRTFIIFFAIANTLLFATLSVLFYQQVRQQYFKLVYNKLISKTEKVDSTFSQLSVEQTSLELLVISATIQNTQDQNAATDKLVKQSRIFAAYIGELYGAEKEQAFFDILKKYDEALAMYARSTREQDTTKIADALSVLSGYPKAITSFYSGLNGGKISESVLQYAFTEYVATIKTALDAYQVQDYQGGFAKRDQALTHIKNLANYLETQLFEEKK